MIEKRPLEVRARLAAEAAVRSLQPEAKGEIDWVAALGVFDQISEAGHTYDKESEDDQALHEGRKREDLQKVERQLAELKGVEQQLKEFSATFTSAEPDDLIWDDHAGALRMLRRIRKGREKRKCEISTDRPGPHSKRAISNLCTSLLKAYIAFTGDRDPTFSKTGTSPCMRFVTAALAHLCEAASEDELDPTRIAYYLGKSRTQIGRQIVRQSE